MTPERLSGGTFLLKRVFPALWFSVLLLPVVVRLASGHAKATEVFPFLLAPVVLGAFGIVIFRKLIWPLADEVSLLGDVLVVRKNGKEERIRLADIVNVSVTRLTNPTQIALRLRRPGKLGDEIVFVPRTEFRFNPFARNKVGEKLILLVDRARQRDHAK